MTACKQAVILSEAKDPATGRESTLSITLEKVTLNENFPESLFAVPMVAPPTGSGN